MRYPHDRGFEDQKEVLSVVERFVYGEMQALNGPEVFEGPWHVYEVSDRDGSHFVLCRHDYRGERYYLRSFINPRYNTWMHRVLWENGCPADVVCFGGEGKLMTEVPSKVRYIRV